VHHLRIARQFALTGEFGLDAHARHLQSVEEDLWRRSDLVLYPSDEETRHVNAWLGAAGIEARASTIPLFAYEGVAALADDSDYRLQGRHDVLFVGGFAHAPNLDGAIWFVREIWPLIRGLHPGHRLCLVGSDPTEGLLALAADDVVVTGHVSEPELVAHYSRARVVVAPLRFGAGTKGKIVEAMRFGVPCVTTTTGAQGLSDANFLRVADEPSAMAAHISELIHDPGAWIRASREAQAFVLERFSVQSVWAALAATMDPEPYPDVDARCRQLAKPRNRVAEPSRGESPD
jgi:glycosyltransferase involved in cell wall biosynthesis